MNQPENVRFSGVVTVFHGRPLPEPAIPAGYAALVEAVDIAAPLPHRLHALGQRHKVLESRDWRLLTPRHAPEPSLAGHLTFALKWEGLDLTVLKRVFIRIGAAPIEDLVRSQPTGAYARRLWFLYEWLTGAALDLPDTSAGKYVDALDTSIQFGAERVRSPRQRVFNNLPGTPDFCPLVRRTEALEAYLSRDLAEMARTSVRRVPRDVMARAAAFLLLSDSKSSFAIEGERPSSNRVERWGQVIGQAGHAPLELTELLRLQRLLIGDARFVHLGLRDDGGFVGERERDTGRPLPDHISARAEDLASLVNGLIRFDRDRSKMLDPVLAAACLAFGFVYVHPFEDGNGRLHRYLIHHALGIRRFNPPEIVFPVSAVILREIDAYRRVLETHSKGILPLIEWEPTDKQNVRVLNDTADFYRYFDATPHAEFLYHCVAETIERDLPQEARFLEAYDRFAARVQDIVDMPAGTIDLLFRFLRQNEGRFSQRARSDEFAALRDDEIESITRAYAAEFGDELRATL